MNPSQYNILLVDDDQVYQFAARKTIEATGLAGEVKVCNHGRDAIEHLTTLMQSTTALPDIIFLDINMPVMDGWQFLDSFRNIEDMLSKKIAIYLVSSSVDKNDMSRSKQISLVKDYLIKPVYKDMFSQVLQTLSN